MFGKSSRDQAALLAYQPNPTSRTILRSLPPNVPRASHRPVMFKYLGMQFVDSVSWLSFSIGCWINNHLE